MSVKALGLNLVATTSFVVAVAISYAYFISRHFGYAGYELYPRGTLSLALTLLLCLAPLLAYRGVRAVSSVVSVFVYGLVYLPTLVTLAIGASFSDRDTFVLQLVFAAAMAVLFAMDMAVIRLPMRVRLPTSMPRLALPITVAVSAYVVFVYWGNLAFVSFQDVYVHRLSNVSIGADVVTRYLTSWLTTVFAPICLAFAFIVKSRLHFVVGVAGFLVMYLATAAKMALLVPAACLAIYWALSGGRGKYFLPLVMIGLSAVCLVLTSAQEAGTPLFLVASLLLVRTVINGGVVSAKYHEFFEAHPQTGLTHVNMIGDAFGSYPYGDLQIGQVVGRYYWGPEMNANAHFWATDGLASFGLAGLPIATAVCAGVFVVLNSVTRGWNQLFVILCFVPFIMSLLNTSVFQSVWSGGALLLGALFMLTDRQQVLRSVTGDEGSSLRPTRGRAEATEGLRGAT